MTLISPPHLSAQKSSYDHKIAAAENYSKLGTMSKIPPSESPHSSANRPGRQFKQLDPIDPIDNAFVMVSIELVHVKLFLCIFSKKNHMTDAHHHCLRRGRRRLPVLLMPPRRSPPGERGRATAMSSTPTAVAASAAASPAGSSAAPSNNRRNYYRRRPNNNNSSSTSAATENANRVLKNDIFDIGVTATPPRQIPPHPTCH